MRSSGITLSVTQLNEYIKGLLGGDILLNNLQLRGEISGFKRHTSGHLYFSVKDEGALIRCVMFRQNAMLLRIAPRDGLRVVLTGYVSFYPRDGALQFYCEGMKPDGVGALYQAFEELKEKLKAEGLFDAYQRQKPAKKIRLKKWAVKKRRACFLLALDLFRARILRLFIK